jgi:periplasmic copper chaperone A
MTAPIEQPRRRRLAAVLAVAAALGMVACDRREDTPPPAGPDVVVEDAWARPATADAEPAAAHGDAHAHHGAGTNSAVYLTLRNRGREADRLVRAESDIARAVEIHETRVEDGIMRMRPVDGVSVDVDGTAELRPGGLHIMLIGLQRSLAPGDRFPVVLHFEKNGAREVEVVVRQP